MGCQDAVDLGASLVFTVTTHDPDTGTLSDADSVPTYRVYEDETATAILTGSMALLDSANTTGFYSEQIACTAANGFEVDKSYSIYIEMTVDSETGGITFGFVVDTVKLDVTLADGVVNNLILTDDVVNSLSLSDASVTTLRLIDSTR